MDKIPVTRPFLPPYEEFEQYLRQIWDSRWLTNNGPFHQEFESKLTEFLDVPYVSLFANGTLALITALQCLDISGEVITTPYSFVATTHSVWWNGIKPVFVDIEPVYGNLDPEKIEAAITPRTTAILPVHVYGNPSKVIDIQNIASKYGLKVIYDAAHAFGVRFEGKSIVHFGDLSILSFHATKSFNTFEGGAIISHHLDVKKRIDHLKNFGFVDEEHIIGHGINAKMTEFQAALGLLQMNYFNAIKEDRRNIFEYYAKGLKSVEGIRFLCPNKKVDYNYAYFPIFIDHKKFGESRNHVTERLRSGNIYVRKYFFPLISNLSAYSSLPSCSKDNLPVANRLSEEVICLPVYPGLNRETQDQIINIVLRR